MVDCTFISSFINFKKTNYLLSRKINVMSMLGTNEWIIIFLMSIFGFSISLTMALVGFLVAIH
jgi:hypothetical protein